MTHYDIYCNLYKIVHASADLDLRANGMQEDALLVLKYLTGGTKLSNLMVHASAGPGLACKRHAGGCSRGILQKIINI